MLMTQVSTKKEVEEAESVNTQCSRNRVWSETYFQPPRLSSDVLCTWNLGWVIFSLNLLIWAPGFGSQRNSKKLLNVVVRAGEIGTEQENAGTKEKLWDAGLTTLRQCCQISDFVAKFGD